MTIATDPTTTTLDMSRPVGEIAIEFPASTRIFEKWKIDFCCGGASPLVEACEKAGAPVEEVVRSIEELRADPEQKDWTRESLTDLHDYIIATHHNYTREEITALDQLADKVSRVHGENHPETRGVAEIVGQMHPELFQHMMKEEQLIFPYVAELEESIATGQPQATPFFGTVENPVRMMMAEHDQVGEMLVELRRVTRDYNLPDDACGSYQALYGRLQDLEADLHQHIHLENNIYFPRAIELEKK